MPKMVEVTEEQLRADAQLRTTVAKILAHPKAKLLVQEAHKMVEPSAITPELDRQREIAAPIDEANKQIVALKNELAADRTAREEREKLDKLQRTIDEGFAKLRSQGWQEEGIAGVKKLMEEKPYLLDPLDAAAIFEKSHPPQNPVHQQGAGGSWNFLEPPAEDQADLKRLIETKGESEQLVLKMAHDALNEVRGQPRR